MKSSIKKYEELFNSIEIQLDDNFESCIKALLQIKKHSSKGVLRNQIISIKSKELLKQIEKANSDDCFSVYCSIVALIECYKKACKSGLASAN